MDFGETLDFTRLVLWLDGNNGNAVHLFNVEVADNALSTSAASLGSFETSYPSGFPQSAQVFDLTDGTGRYLRINTTAAHSGCCSGIAEVAAEAGGTSAVTTPATLVLFGLGLAGLGWSRRKKA